MKTILKKAVPVVLSVMMLFVGIVPAASVHAANTVGPDLKLQKVFSKADYGVATPNVTFHFDIKKHSFNGDTSFTERDKCPDLADMTPEISYDFNDDTNGLNVPGCHLKKLTGDLLNNVTFDTYGVGQYTYSIKEIAPTGQTNAVYSSSAEYLVSIFIKKNNLNNNVVDKIVIAKTKNDAGEPLTDPPKIAYAYDSDRQTSNIVFYNEYRKTAGTDTIVPGSTTPSAAELSGFVLLKKVEGSDDYISTFPFTLYLDPPWGISTATSNPTYRIVSAGGTVGEKVSIQYSTLNNLELAHGERLVLNDVLLGTFIRVNETDSHGYVKTISGQMDGVTINGTEPLITYGVHIGEAPGGNHILFTNTQQQATGVLLANLPFIILFLVAVSGILLFVRNRRKAHSTE
ncbi:MAG: DUF7601 domain-containing protein [Lentihominibacter sp.]|jgi:hypothetical protein